MTQRLRPVTPEDIYLFRSITDVQLSPDGRRIAYVLKTVEGKRDAYFSSIFVVGAEVGEPQQITAGELEDVAPRWFDVTTIAAKCGMGVHGYMRNRKEWGCKVT